MICDVTIQRQHTAQGLYPKGEQMMIHYHRIRAAVRIAALGFVTAALWAAGGVSPVRACSTPVFRYAMYNWAPAPYYVFYLHHGQLAEEDEAVNQLLGELARANPPANLAFSAVDVSKEEDLKGLPKVVRRAYESHAEGQRPLHLVYAPWVLTSAWMFEQYAAPPAEESEENKEAETPAEVRPEAAGQTAGGPDAKEQGQEDEGPPEFPPLFSGRLDQKTVEAMVDSPVRKRIGDLLKEGNAAVLLLLTGPDEEANQQAEKESAQVVARAADGEFPVSGGDDFPPDQFLPEGPDARPGQDEGKKDGARQDDSSNQLKLAVLKLSRTDPAEKWLVDSLLLVEPDLREDRFAKSPMVFAVYGRGRAMPPYVDKGITAENLAECVMFLCGPCSCMVKDQNPGSDLLVRRDWDAVAEALAADDPEFGGGQFGYQEFEPSESGEWTQASAAGARADETDPPAGDPEAESAEPGVAEIPAPKPDAESSARQARGGGMVPVEDKVPTYDKAPSGGTTDPFAMRQTWSIGIWVALAAVVVLAAGFVLILRQRP